MGQPEDPVSETFQQFERQTAQRIGGRWV